MKSEQQRVPAKAARTRTTNLPALFIGRFQPFHNGHLDAIKQILAREQHIIIAIGSAQKSRTAKNPFTAHERSRMIKAALSHAKISEKTYSIKRVTDINHNSRWPRHIENLLPQFETVYTGSALVRVLFETFSEHPVRTLKMHTYKMRAHEKRQIVSSTRIRELMKKNNPVWQQLVSPPVAQLLKKWGTAIKDIPTK